MIQAGGSTLGRYELVRKLATGGMAEVFLAKAAGPGGFEKTLVIKRVLPTLVEDPTFIQMFLNEARLAAQFNHPNLVQIFDFGEVDGMYFLAMEYIDGPNLRTVLRQTTERVPLPIAAKLISFACEGLAYAHEFASPETGEPLGLVHRDVSPDNLLIGRNGAVKVVDFGVAKAAGEVSSTRAGTVKGKIAYMAPEQIRGDMDRRVDVYALGVILYEMATGSRPYTQTNDVALITAILQQEPVPALTRRPDLPPELVTIIEQAMARDPDLRYQSCRDLQGSLEDFLVTQGERVGTQHLAQFISSTDRTLTPGRPASGADAAPPNLSGTPGGRAGGAAGTGAAARTGLTPAPAAGRSGITPTSSAGRSTATPAGSTPNAGVTPAGRAPRTGITPAGGASLASTPVPPSNPSLRTPSGAFMAPLSYGAPTGQAATAAALPASAPVARGQPTPAYQADPRVASVVAEAERLRNYAPPAPVASEPVLQSVRREFERDESLTLPARFAALAGKLVSAHRDAPAVLSERLGGVVDALMLVEDHAGLVRLMGRLEGTSDAPADPGTAWVRETLVRALNSPARIQRIIERLREEFPPDLEALHGSLSFGAAQAVPLLLQALDQTQAPANRDLFKDVLAGVVGKAPALLLARLAEEPLRHVADLCYLAEKGRVPDRFRPLRSLLGRRDPAVRKEALAGMSKARSDDAFNLLSQALGDRTEEVRLHALDLLAAHFPDGALPLADALLRQPSFESRSSAERMAVWRVIGASGAPAALETIAQVLRQKASLFNKKKIEEAKLEAFQGLATMKTNAARRLLDSILEDRTQPDALIAAARAQAAKLALQEAEEPPRLVPYEMGRIDRRLALARGFAVELMALVNAATVLDVASAALEDAFNHLIARLQALSRLEGKVRVIVSEGQLSINAVLLHVGGDIDADFDHFASVLARRGIGGFAFDVPIAVQELRELVRWLAEGAVAGEVNAPHVELQRNLPAEIRPAVRPLAPGDPTRQAMTTFVDCIHNLRAYITDPISTRGKLTEAAPLLDSLVDAFRTRAVRFLGMTPLKVGREALTFHHANVTVLALAFGVEIGLPRQRLRELAEYAYFHDIGMFGLPEALLLKSGELTSEDQDALRRARLASAWFPFEQLGSSRRAVNWATAVLEYGLEFGVRDADGAVQQRNEVGVAGGMLALCKTFDALTSRRSYRPAQAPEDALQVLGDKAAARFRIDLLGLFLKFLQGQTVREIPNAR